MRRFHFPLAETKPGFDLRSALDIVEAALDDEGLDLARHNGTIQPFALLDDGMFIVHVPDSMIQPKAGGHDDYDHLRESADAAEHQRHMRTGEYVDLDDCAACARLVDSAT